jgi:hypothetical protein
MNGKETLLPAWKFKGNWIPYDQLDKRGILLASYNCINFIDKNFRGIHYWEYKYNTATSEKWKHVFKSNKERCAVDLEYYSNQITHLEARAVELGFQLPDDKYKVMDILKSEYPKNNSVKK